MILIADSGSTKTQWVSDGCDITTQGINPVRDTRDKILEVLRTELVPQLSPDVTPQSIHFYGAGCIKPYSESVETALAQVFPQADISVDSDLLGAARALYQDHEGIACILGTGSNSCLYNGRHIALNTPALGYILGDEGSGAVLGRILVGGLIKGTLTPTLWQDFQSEMHLTQTDIIDRVYRQPQPNRFLASLVPFIARHTDDASIHHMLIHEFTRFLQRNVKPYHRPDLPVGFVGGVATQFRHQLTLAVEQSGMILGEILQKPAQKMLQYHKK